MALSIPTGRYLTVDPRRNSGELLFKGTRIPVRTVFDELAEGASVDSILFSHPELSRTALAEALELAEKALLSPYEPTEPPPRPFLPKRKACAQGR